jgi:hypothetical protein
MEPAILFELLKGSPWAALVAIIGYLYHRKDMALMQSYLKRIEDNAKVATVIEATNTASRALEQTSENRSRVLESFGEATRASTEAIKQMTATLDLTRQTVERDHAVTQLTYNNLEAARRDRQTDFDGLKRSIDELISDLRKARRS